MYKIFCYSVWMMTLWVSARAQPAGFTSVKDISAFREQFRKASASVQSMRADFRQEKKLAMLSEKIRSSGVFMFSRPDKVRMEYLKPLYYLMVIDRDRIYIKDGDKESTVNAKSNKVFRQINTVMMQTMNGTILDNADFQVLVFEGGGQYLIELTPRAPALSSLFRKIIIMVTGNAYMVGRIELWEQGGDNTIIYFSNPVVNGQMADALFKVR